MLTNTNSTISALIMPTIPDAAVCTGEFKSAMPRPPWFGSLVRTMITYQSSFFYELSFVIRGTEGQSLFYLLNLQIKKIMAIFIFIDYLQLYILRFLLL